MKCVCLVITCLLLTVSCSVTYDGYQVVRFSPETEGQVLQLKNLPFKVDYWKEPTIPGEDVDIMIGPDQVVYLNTLDVPGKVYIEDVGSLVQKHQPDTRPIPSMLPYNTSRFYTRDELHEFVDEEAAACGADCAVVTIGTSYEGSPLKVIRISRPGTDRPSIWIDAGVHAREWLAPAVASYFIDRLINDYGTDPDVTALRDNFDWHILNLVNPDGYHFTWTDERLWRKTRRPNSGSPCLGTDGNRNYDYVWNLGSDVPCDETYRGESPESESEIASLTAYVLTLAPSARLSASLHTYGQVLLRPWGYTPVDPPDYLELVRLGNIGVDAINANSDVTYTLGKTSGAGSGMSMDWAKAAAGIEYSYTMEMRDEGQYGFLAPPQEILPTCVEIFAGISAMAMDIASQP